MQGRVESKKVRCNVFILAWQKGVEDACLEKNPQNNILDVTIILIAIIIKTDIYVMVETKVLTKSVRLEKVLLDPIFMILKCEFFHSLWIVL